MRSLVKFFAFILLAIGLPGISFATETSTTIMPARHSVQPTGRNVYLTHESCETARLTGNISGYGPSTPAIRSAEVSNKRVGLVARFSDQTLSAMRARGESLQGCVLEDTSVYTDGRGHSHATGQTRRGRFWVVKNLEDLYDRAGRQYDWWCANLITDFPQPREDAPASRVDVPATDVTVRVAEPATRHVYQRVPVIVHHVPQVTEVWDPPVVTRRSGRVDVPAPTEEVIYEEEDCGCQEEPAEPVRDTYTRREWHRCGDRIGDMVADHDGYYLVTYER